MAYISFRKALALLQSRVGATQEAVAAWICLGKNNGGLDAYINANEIDPPRRFYFSALGGVDDAGVRYLAELKFAWFDADEIDKFTPKDRYITSDDLIKRWSDKLGEDPTADILAKVSESSLMPIHPVSGLTQWEGTGDDVHGLAPRKAALFSLSEIEAIEEEDFGIDETADDSESSPSDVIALKGAKVDALKAPAAKVVPVAQGNKLNRNSLDPAIDEAIKRAGNNKLADVYPHYPHWQR